MKFNKILSLWLVIAALLMTVAAAAPELVVSGVTFKINNGNSAALAEDATTAAIKPLNNFTLSYTITNNHTLPITVHQTQLIIDENDDDTFDADTEPTTTNNDSFKLEVGASAVKTITLSVPLDLAENNYSTNLSILGDADDDTDLNDIFSFILAVTQTYQDVVVSSITLTPAELTCSNTFSAEIIVTNLGNINQNAATGGQVTLTLNAGTQVLDTESFDLLANSANTVTFAGLSAANLPTNTLTAKATYWYGVNQALKTAVLNKQSCLTETGTSTLNLGLGTPTTLTVSLKDETKNNLLKWSLNNVEIAEQEGLTSYIFSSATAGTYTVKAVWNNDAANTKTWTINVQAPVTANLETSEIFFDNAAKKTALSKTFTLKNIGTIDSITGITFDTTSQINSKYNLKLSNTPANGILTAQQTATVTVELTIPEDETTGTKHSIGNIIIRTNNANITKTLPVYVNPNGFLIIDSVKVNDKTSGDLLLNEINKLRITIRNDYTEDITDVTVKAKLLDVDGEDLEAEADSFDLKDNDDKEITLEFDLSNEHLDQASYTLSIIAEGEADDNSKHTATETKELNVKRENHQIIIKEAALYPVTLNCGSFSNLQVKVENTGKNNEDNIKIKVKNSDLKLDLTSVEFDLDKYSGSDYENTESFNIRTTEAVKGTYPLTIEIYRDGSFEGTKEVILIVEDCSASTLGTKTITQVETQLASGELAQQLQQQIQTRQEQQQNVVRASASFREGDTYVILLGTLIAFVLVALVLGLAVLVIKRK